MIPEPKGPEAAWLRKRKYGFLERFAIPAEGIAGSLALTHTRCGKHSCRCAQGELHTAWRLTFMVDGKKRVERVPKEWVDEVRRLVDIGRDFKEATAAVFTANARLLVLSRKQARR
jgi:hypothetical protein